MADAIKLITQVEEGLREFLGEWAETKKQIQDIHSRLNKLPTGQAVFYTEHIQTGQPNRNQDQFEPGSVSPFPLAAAKRAAEQNLQQAHKDKQETLKVLLEEFGYTTRSHPDWLKRVSGVTPMDDTAAIDALRVIMSRPQGMMAAGEFGRFKDLDTELLCAFAGLRFAETKVMARVFDAYRDFVDNWPLKKTGKRKAVTSFHEMESEFGRLKELYLRVDLARARYLWILSESTEDNPSDEVLNHLSIGHNCLTHSAGEFVEIDWPSQ